MANLYENKEMTRLHQGHMTRSRKEKKGKNLPGIELKKTRNEDREKGNENRGRCKAGRCGDHERGSSRIGNIDKGSR